MLFTTSPVFSVIRAPWSYAPFIPPFAALPVNSAAAMAPFAPAPAAFKPPFTPSFVNDVKRSIPECSRRTEGRSRVGGGEGVKLFPSTVLPALHECRPVRYCVQYKRYKHDTRYESDRTVVLSLQKPRQKISFFGAADHLTFHAAAGIHARGNGTPSCQMHVGSAPAYAHVRAPSGRQDWLGTNYRSPSPTFVHPC